MATRNPTRILVVCLGNICRSPMGQGVIEARAVEAGLKIEIDSAGLGPWHVGNPPHPQGIRVAAARGYDTSAQRARQIRSADFHDFDLILGMDASNIIRLNGQLPPDATAELRLFHPSGQDIPDPYGQGDAAFHHALDLIEEATESLIAELASPAS